MIRSALLQNPHKRELLSLRPPAVQFHLSSPVTTCHQRFTTCHQRFTTCHHLSPPVITCHHLSSPTAADARVLSVSMTVHSFHYDSFACITYSLIILTCITYSHLHHLQWCFKRVPGVPRVGLSVARWVEGFGQFGCFARFGRCGRFGRFGRFG